MDKGRGWIAPAMGIVFVALVVAAFVILGEGKDPTKDSAQEIVDYYNDNFTKQTVGTALVGFAAVPLLFFAGALRNLLREAGGPRETLSLVGFGGAVLLAGGLAVGATINFALVDFADDIDPVAVQAINAINYDYFFPFIAGMAAFLLATGISAVRSRALPRWLSWVAIVLGVICFAGPVGFAGVLGGLLWILVTSIVLMIRARSAGTAAATG
jgi:hypothetical protein